eukprot:3768285-Rhodomonas_salina.3
MCKPRALIAATASMSDKADTSAPAAHASRILSFQSRSAELTETPAEANERGHIRSRRGWKRRSGRTKSEEQTR